MVVGVPRLHDAAAGAWTTLERPSEQELIERRTLSRVARGEYPVTRGLTGMSEQGRLHSIDAVFERIAAHAGEVFHQIRGAEFRYGVQSDHIIPDQTNQRIAKSEFAKALELVPLPDTVSVQSLRGPSYIYSILMDESNKGRRMVGGVL